VRSLLVVVRAIRPRGMSTEASPAGVLVAAESAKSAVAAAEAWVSSNAEWEFGPHVLEVFPYAGRDDLGDEAAMLIQVNFPKDSQDVRDTLRRETELMDAARRDEASRDAGYWSTEQIQVLERHRKEDRWKRWRSRLFAGKRGSG